jgi:hypothetical protein
MYLPRQQVAAVAMRVVLVAVSLAHTSRHVFGTAHTPALSPHTPTGVRADTGWG